MMFSKKQNKKHTIYMDHAAGTPLVFAVFEKMKPYFIEDFYNAGSIYAEGVQAKNAMDNARKSIAETLSARAQEIIFCDGGTEANNLAIRGVVSAWRAKHQYTKPHIITSVIEHASILETCRDLMQHNLADVTFISVDEQGIINHKELKKALSENTILVSIGYVNGEIGVIQDIRAIAKMIRHYKKHAVNADARDGLLKNKYPYFHTDAVQAFNYLPIHVQKMGVDMMTLNSSKIYGPKKMALLYKKPSVDIDPIITGGNQEFELRAGTENTPYIIGFAESISMAEVLRDAEVARLGDLQSYFQAELVKKINAMCVINAQQSERIPNIINISIPDLSSEEIVLRLDAVGIQVSVKSACKSREDGDSHVIRALRDTNTQSIRFSMGRSTQKDDIDSVITRLVRIVDDMKKVFDLYYKK